MNNEDHFEKQESPLSGRGVSALGNSLSTTLNAPQSEPELSHLLGIINNTISRYNDAINRFDTMNTHLTGARPEKAPNAESVKSVEMHGILHELITRAEVLHDMCAELDQNNNRLNRIIVDG